MSKLIAVVVSHIGMDASIIIYYGIWLLSIAVGVYIIVGTSLGIRHIRSSSYAPVTISSGLPPLL